MRIGAPSGERDRDGGVVQWWLDFVIPFGNFEISRKTSTFYWYFCISSWYDALECKLTKYLITTVVQVGNSKVGIKRKCHRPSGVGKFTLGILKVEVKFIYVLKLFQIYYTLYFSQSYFLYLLGPSSHLPLRTNNLRNVSGVGAAISACYEYGCFLIPRSSFYLHRQKSGW